MFRRVSTWDQQPQDWVDLYGQFLAPGSLIHLASVGVDVAGGRIPTVDRPVRVAFPAGVGVSFTGSTSQRLEYAAPISAGDHAIVAVFRTSSTGAQGIAGLYKTWASPDHVNSYLSIESSGAICAITSDGSNWDVAAGPTVVAGRTYTAVAVFRASGGRKLFLDGRLVASSATSRNPTGLVRFVSGVYINPDNSAASAFSGQIGLSGVLPFAPTDDVAASLSTNPWQLFSRGDWVFSNVAAGGGGGNVTVSISGLGASALAGNLAPSLSASISGAAASLAAGNVGVSSSVAASGVSAAGQVGSLKAALSVALSGLQATGGIGTVTAQIAGNVTVSISGVSATVQAGAVVPALAISVTGLGSASAVGSVTRSQSVGITGIQSAAQAGTVTTTGGVEQVKSKGLRKTRYTPGRVPSDAKELARFIQNELERLTDALESPFTHQLLEVLHAEPSRKSGEAAMVACADGTDWNPGAGRGLYLYDPQTAVWSKIS